MTIDWEKYVVGVAMGNDGEYVYILWRNRDEDGKFIYQVTKGEQPSKDDGGYYNKCSLLKLKGLH